MKKITKRILTLILALTFIFSAVGQSGTVLAKSYVYKYGAYYYNAYGVKVHRPSNYRYVPAGASALCWDGTYSFSLHARGTCSHHGGVNSWL